MISSLWMSELRVGDWSEIGSGVTVSSGGTTALDHGLLVVQSAGALDWHRAEVNRLFPITANTEYTAELWYYAETGTRIFITMDIDEKVEAYVENHCFFFDLYDNIQFKLYEILLVMCLVDVRMCLRGAKVAPGSATSRRCCRRRLATLIVIVFVCASHLIAPVVCALDSALVNQE